MAKARETAAKPNRTKGTCSMSSTVILAWFMASLPAAGSPRDAERVVDARDALEDYVSQFVSMKYRLRIETVNVEKDDSADTSNFRQQVTSQAVAKDLGAQVNANAKTVRATIESEVIQLLPNFIMQKSRQTLDRGNGLEKERTTQHFLNGNESIRIDHALRLATFASTLPRDHSLEAYLTHAMGCRMVGSYTATLADALADPSIVTILGEEVMEDSRVLHLKVGPPLPNTIRPPSWRLPRSLEMWLDIDKGFVPKKWSVVFDYQGKRHQNAFHNERFAKTIDPLTKKMVHYPSVINRVNGRVSYRWVVSDFSANPPVAINSLRPTVPSGYVVMKDGKRDETRIKGGGGAWEQRQRDTVKRARVVMETTPPSATDQELRASNSSRGFSGWQLMAAVSVLSLAACLRYFVVRGRGERCP